MTTTSTAGPGSIGTATPSRGLLRVAAAGAAAATVVNAGLWAGGRAADVSFRVTPLGADTATHVGIVSVVATTLVVFCLGAGLLALAARRSRGWVRAVVVTAALFALVSATGPISTAEDAATGVVLATMHLAAGAVFLVTTRRVGS
jgi:hypothetical protein